MGVNLKQLNILLVIKIKNKLRKKSIVKLKVLIYNYGLKKK